MAEQLRDAKHAALEQPGQLHSFLLKPESKEERSLESALRALGRQLGELAGFQLIGVTEKEPRNTFLERMVGIGRLRRALDDSSMCIPIHLFGALDPLSFSLYFLAGAEVFNGPTWSKYAYQRGQCIYIHNGAAMTYGIDVTDEGARVHSIKDNIRSLDELERPLRKFSETGGWDLFLDNWDFARKATEEMRVRLVGVTNAKFWGRIFQRAPRTTRTGLKATRLGSSDFEPTLRIRSEPTTWQFSQGIQ